MPGFIRSTLLALAIAGAGVGFTTTAQAADGLIIIGIANYGAEYFNAYLASEATMANPKWQPLEQHTMKGVCLDSLRNKDSCVKTVTYYSFSVAPGRHYLYSTERMFAEKIVFFQDRSALTTMFGNRVTPESKPTDTYGVTVGSGEVVYVGDWVLDMERYPARIQGPTRRDEGAEAERRKQTGFAGPMVYRPLAKN